MIDAVLFDLDGVLINSFPSGHKARTALFAHYGVDLSKIPDPHNETHKGNSLESILQLVASYHPDIFIDTELFTTRLIEDIHKDLKKNNASADPGLIRLLQELQRHTIPCAIVTSGLARGVRNKLDILGIEEYFQLIITANDVSEHKPDPASYLLAIKTLSVAPKNCIIFEDSAAGIKAGNAAEIKVIGFTKYNNQKSALAGTVATIDSWDDIHYDLLLEHIAS